MPRLSKLALFLFLLIALFLPVEQKGDIVLSGPIMRTLGSGIPTGNSWTVIGTNANGNANILYAAGNAGDIVVLGVRWTTAGTTISSVSTVDSGNMTAATAQQNHSVASTAFHFQMFYKAAATTSSDVATVNFSGSATFPRLCVWRLRASGTISLDATSTGSTGTTDGSAGSGQNTTLVTSAFTTGSQNGITCVMGSTYNSSTFTTHRVGGNVPTEIFMSNAGVEAWDYKNTAQLVGATCTATLGTSSEWCAQSVTLKAL